VLFRSINDLNLHDEILESLNTRGIKPCDILVETATILYCKNVELLVPFCEVLDSYGIKKGKIVNLYIHDRSIGKIEVNLPKLCELIKYKIESPLELDQDGFFIDELSYNFTDLNFILTKWGSVITREQKEKIFNRIYKHSREGIISLVEFKILIKGIFRCLKLLEREVSS
jgi:hypothetical protein